MESQEPRKGWGSLIVLKTFMALSDIDHIIDDERGLVIMVGYC